MISNPTPQPKDLVIIQRDDTNAFYEEIHISGSNKIIYIDASGYLNADDSASFYILYPPPAGGITTGSTYPITASWAIASLSSSYPWFNTGSNIAYIGGNVGIGTIAPVNKLDVSGNISCSVITASLFNGTASYAYTASYVSASNIVGNITALSSSWASSSISASVASTASYAVTSSYASNAQQLIVDYDWHLQRNANNVIQTTHNFVPGSVRLARNGMMCNLDNGGTEYDYAESGSNQLKLHFTMSGQTRMMADYILAN